MSDSLATSVYLTLTDFVLERVECQLHRKPCVQLEMLLRLFKTALTSSGCRCGDVLLSVSLLCSAMANVTHKEKEKRKDKLIPLAVGNESIAYFSGLHTRKERKVGSKRDKHTVPEG